MNALKDMHKDSANNFAAVMEMALDLYRNNGFVPPLAVLVGDPARGQENALAPMSWESPEHKVFLLRSLAEVARAQRFDIVYVLHSAIKMRGNPSSIDDPDFVHPMHLPLDDQQYSIILNEIDFRFGRCQLVKQDVSMRKLPGNASGWDVQAKGEAEAEVSLDLNVQRSVVLGTSFIAGCVMAAYHGIRMEGDPRVDTVSPDKPGDSDIQMPDLG